MSMSSAGMDDLQDALKGVQSAQRALKDGDQEQAINNLIIATGHLVKACAYQSGSLSDLEVRQLLGRPAGVPGDEPASDQA